MRGVVHIMVVNTFKDARDMSVAGATPGGQHWFVVAWYVDP